MPIATLNSMGQIVLPRVVRRLVPLEIGYKIYFLRDESGDYRLFARRKDGTKLHGLVAGRVARPISVEELGEAV